MASSPLLRSLERLDRTHRTDRKLLVGPTLLWGREALRALARNTGGWTGWEAVTLRSVADDLAFVALSDAGTRPASDIEIGTLIGIAIDQAIRDGAVNAKWRELSSHAGFRRAIRDGVLELRTAGISATASAPELTAVLQRFAALLDQRKLVDPAGVFTAALASIDTEAPFVLEGRLFLAPGLGTRGLPGRLLQHLLDRGAQVLGWSAPAGQTPPPGYVESLATPDAAGTEADIDLFAAATPADEVREALRRGLSEGLRLDEIELATSDPDAYGTALDALARRLGFDATLQEGLPHQRSRVGRAAARHLDWMEQGLHADLLREALEAGDVTPPDHESTIDPAILAEALRERRIGWGRARYDAALAALRPEDPVQHRLAGLLRHLLGALPPTPELGGGPEPRVTPQGIAKALLSFLELVPLHDDSDRFNAERLRNRVTQLAESEEGERPFGAAMAEVRETLADFRVWTQVTAGVPPRLSRGGAVHLADLRHAGVTGRRRVFVLGLDADRVAGPRVSDPLLPDAVRQELPGLGSTAARRAEARWLVARAIAGVGGRVTLSFACDGDDGREAGPAPVLLDVARELGHDPSLDYKRLRAQLGAPSCPVPGTDAQVLDQRDAWLRAIGSGDALLDGTEAVRGRHAGLDAGLLVVESLEAEALNEHHGLVAPAAGRFDPTRPGAGTISATSLERLSRCPLSWFYKHALEIRAPEDPEYAPEEWLDPLERGALLHAVFEAFVKQYRGRQDQIGTPEAAAALQAICETLLAAQRETTPPPSETVFQTERDEILSAARSFLEMEKALHAKPPAPAWEEAEGWLDRDKAVVTLPDGRRFHLTGRIDRVDGLPRGVKLIVDFKTGSTWPFRRNSKAGPLNGGRHLQPALYAAAYAAQTGKRVGRFEYRFPTARGRNQITAHHPPDLALGLEIVAGVLSGLEHGAFLPTLDADDCKYCEHRDICRVRGGEEPFDKVRSPRAEWAETLGAASPLYAEMRARRNKS